MSTPETAGVGLDLSAASDVVGYSHTWDIIMKDQADERCSGMGKASVSVTDLEAVGTIDGQILGCHRRKRSVSAEVAREILAAGS